MAALQRTLMALPAYLWHPGGGGALRRPSSPAAATPSSPTTRACSTASSAGCSSPTTPSTWAKRELRRWIPSISLNLRWGGNASSTAGIGPGGGGDCHHGPPRPGARTSAWSSSRQGSRSRDGRLRAVSSRGQRGAAGGSTDRLAVIPRPSTGRGKLLRHRLFPIPFGTRIRIRFGDPIRASWTMPAAVLGPRQEWIQGTVASGRPCRPENRSGLARGAAHRRRSCGRQRSPDVSGGM